MKKIFALLLALQAAYKKRRKIMKKWLICVLDISGQEKVYFTLEEEISSINIK